MIEHLIKATKDVIALGEKKKCKTKHKKIENKMITIYSKPKANDNERKASMQQQYRKNNVTTQANIAVAN